MSMHSWAVLLSLAILIACTCQHSLASDQNYEQLANELYGDADEATSVSSTPVHRPLVPSQVKITESYATQSPNQNENDRPLDDDPGNFLPDDLTVEEIVAMIDVRQQALATTTQATARPATARLASGTPSRQPESLGDRQAREAKEAREAEERRARQIKAQQEEARRREEARMREARERAKFSPWEHKKYMEEMFGSPVLDDAGVQKIAEQLLREQERRDIEASKRLPSDYRHLDAGPTFDEAVARAEGYKPEKVDEECRICLEPLRDGPAIKLACGDAFHTICIKRWIQAQKGQLKDCPTCRKPVQL